MCREGCDARVYALGLCKHHYFTDYRRRRRRRDDLPRCGVDGCCGPQQARGLCHRHYQAWWKYGDPTVGDPTPTRALLWWLRDKGYGDMAVAEGAGVAPRTVHRIRTGATPTPGRPTCLKIQRFAYREARTELARRETREHTTEYGANIGPDVGSVCVGNTPPRSVKGKHSAGAGTTTRRAA